MSINDEIRSGISCTYQLWVDLPWELQDWLSQASLNESQKYGQDLDVAADAMHMTGSFDSLIFEYASCDEAELARPRVLKVLAEYTALAWERQNPQR